MTDEKKPKIDLKKRLGKKTITTKGGPSIPPPVGIPKPVAGLASAPTASKPAQAAPPPKPQEIKVDTEEVAKAQRSGRIVTVAVAGGAAVVGIVLGVGVGSSWVKADLNRQAIEDAGELATDVKKANGTIDELFNTLTKASRTLGDGAFPEAEVDKLGKLIIPFSGANLQGRKISLFNKQTIVLLTEYTNKVAEAEELRDGLAALLSARKKKVLEEIEAKTRPQLEMGVVFGPVKGGEAGGRAWVGFLPLKKPLPVFKPPGWKPPKDDEDDKKKKKKKKDEKPKYKWPEEINFGSKEKPNEYKVYSEYKDLKKDKVIVPVNPASFAKVCPSGGYLNQMRRNIAKMVQILEPPPIPGQDNTGLRKIGKELHNKLQEIADAG